MLYSKLCSKMHTNAYLGSRKLLKNSLSYPVNYNVSFTAAEKVIHNNITRHMFLFKNNWQLPEELYFEIKK